MTTPYTKIGAGLNLTAPPNQMDPGAALLCVNYETPDTGGYRSISGYQLFGGGAVPGTGPILGLTVFQGKALAIRELGGVARLSYTGGASWTTVAGDLPVGTYRFASGNFYALAASESLFMVCDQGKPWKWDGASLVELAAAPSGAAFIEVHTNRLFLGFAAGSVQYSALGEPNDWDSSVSDAGEVGVSDTVTALASTIGVLVIGCKNSIQLLYGETKTEYVRKDFARGAGVSVDTMAVLGTLPVFKSDRGITSLQAVQSFGDFEMGDWARHVAPYFDSIASPTCTMISRSRNQYRMFFDDKTALLATFSGSQLVGITSAAFPDATTLCASGDDGAGGELSVFADDAGQVFRMDTGTSFNGEPINTYITLAYNHFGSPVARKRFRRMHLDIQARDPVDISLLPTFDFGDDRIPRHGVQFARALAAGGLWGIDKWDGFAWGTPILNMHNVHVAGSGTHMGLVINTSSATAKPHTLLGYTAHFDARRVMRG
ncbi:hypothetical protein [Pontibacterium sp.]|uniref:hypothetical protein n=1 Tax=Pontibacterium sp. TaxID=2036026 RepID=UPI003567CEFA